MAVWNISYREGYSNGRLRIDYGSFLPWERF